MAHTDTDETNNDGRGLRCALPSLLCVMVIMLGLTLILVQSDPVALMQAGRLNVSDDKTLDALMYAIEMKDAGTVTRILRRPGLNLNGRDIDGQTPLLRAARERWFEGCRLLLERGADVNAADGQSRTSLMHSAYGQGDDAVKLVDLLLKHAADVNAADAVGQTPLILAAQLGRADVIRRLLLAGADVNRAAKTGWTPLHWSKGRGDPEIIELLLSAGADSQAPDDTGLIPADIQHAVKIGAQ